ncbi:PREDICTED: desiccation-related protein PCC13-62 [Theobroma cacao]|uniref:Desiccation-related protein PCC13-62 n=1 Tax=Theobroma cacao TaxID=3641 RepID=A0AB32W2G1_THECC|nr:PREDICTED: desiccation-related protein PCC13-62 [Theobroma cacao]
MEVRTEVRYACKAKGSFSWYIDLRVLGASLLAIESARYGVLRTQLYLRVNATVPPYRFTVANLTERIAQLTNRLGMCGQKDEGLVVPLALGAENRTTSNIIAANVNSLLLPRTILEVFRIFFGTGNASMTGGFFPNGMNGAIAENIIRRGLV